MSNKDIKEESDAEFLRRQLSYYEKELLNEQRPCLCGHLRCFHHRSGSYCNKTTGFFKTCECQCFIPNMKKEVKRV